MSKLSSEEERRLIAEVEALRDDPDSPLSLVRLEPAENPRAFLRVELPFETIGRLHTVAEANDLTMGEVIVQALEAFEGSGRSPARDESEANPSAPRRRDRRKSARAS